jgi:hypothetical protein
VARMSQHSLTSEDMFGTKLGLIFEL